MHINSADTADGDIFNDIEIGTIYEDGLASILDKKQMKKWKKAKKHYQTEQQIRMEREFGAMGGFGGGLGGDFGGFGGGGFGGGFPGGGGFGF